MKGTVLEVGRSLGRLLLFLYWYAAGVTLLFYLLPSLGRLLEQQYDSLSLPTRLVLLLGLLPLAIVAQVWGRRRRKPRTMLYIRGKINHPPG